MEATLFSTSETAALFHVTRDAVVKWIRTGKFLSGEVFNPGGGKYAITEAAIERLKARVSVRREECPRRNCRQLKTIEQRKAEEIARLKARLKD